MYVLHGTWLASAQRFIFWGEDVRAAQPHVVAPDDVHPYTLDAEALLRHLDRMAPAAQPDGEIVPIWLPSAPHYPSPSSEARDAGAHYFRRATRLYRWSVFALTLTSQEAMVLLQNLASVAPQGIPGSDLRFWRDVVEGVLYSLSTGAFVPALHPVSDAEHIAYWRPQVDDDTLAQWERDMPTICFATMESVREMPDRRGVLDSFLVDFTDRFVRESHIAVYHHPWLKALMRPQPVAVEAYGAPGAQLYEEWLEWLKGPLPEGDEWGLALTLHEPQPGSALWCLSFGLFCWEAGDEEEDEFFVVSAKDIFAHPNDRTQDWYGFCLNQPIETLRKALYQAGLAYPPLLDSYYSTQVDPLYLTLSNDRAYQFLTQAANLLMNMGVWVGLPEWYTEQVSLQARGRLRSPQPEGDGKFFSRKSLLKFHWEIITSPEKPPLAPEVMRRLLESEAALVHEEGQWWVLSPELRRKLRAALDMAEQSEHSLTVMEALDLLAQADAEALAEQHDIEIAEQSLTVDDWLVDVFNRVQNPHQTPIPHQPDRLQANLRPYQARGFGWLAQMRDLGMGACLADDMGLGKTIQTIAYWLHVQDTEVPTAPALLVCPTSVVGNWYHEIKRFAPDMNVLKHQGANRLKGDDFISEAAHM
ncbi:MAG: SNF2-related protein, partial [Anaerolineales bacterium]